MSDCETLWKQNLIYKHAIALLNEGFHSWELLKSEDDYKEAKQFIREKEHWIIDDYDMELIIARMELLEDE